MIHTFWTPFEDIDYETWAKKVGIRLMAVEPNPEGGFDLKCEGPLSLLDRFANEMGLPVSCWPSSKGNAQ